MKMLKKIQRLYGVAEVLPSAVIGSFALIIDERKSVVSHRSSIDK